MTKAEKYLAQLEHEMNLWRKKLTRSRETLLILLTWIIECLVRQAQSMPLRHI